MPKGDATKSSPVYRYRARIQKQLHELSTAEQTVASHLSAHPEQVPFETAHSLAKRLGVSAMTVGRALKALGYRGLADLRTQLRNEVSDTDAPWGHRPASRPALKNRERARSLRAELEAIEGIYALAETPAWHKAVKLISSADQVFVTGFQTERGLAVAFADQLAYVRPRVRYLNVDNRAFSDLRVEANTGSCLVMVDGRRYSRWFRLLADRAVELKIPLIIATDAYCSWSAKLTTCSFQARTDSGRFWDNNAPILSLLNLLVEDVIERLGNAVHPSLDAASEFASTFVGFERVPRHRGQRKSSTKLVRD
jgi:DNA-binding MurR/RpiR family transcriptional regulator